MKNPYPTRQGFGLRVRYATNALKNLALGNDEAIDRRSKETYSRVHSRQMDNCFELPRLHQDSLRCLSATRKRWRKYD